MIIKPEDLKQIDRYKLMIGSILPRPIAWVSTMDEDGNFNLAPFSFFTVGATEPMTLIFCPQVHSTTLKKKDTLRNIEKLPEFVVNLTNEDTAQEMNRTATALPYGQSEFDWAPVTPVASDTISVPRVKEAPVAFECVLQRIVTISEGSGGGSAVFGEVKRIHIRDDIYTDGYVQMEIMKPIGRLAGSAYTRVTDLFHMDRLPPPGDPTEE
ncbi:MAG TPA: flavin reductase family protein [candidate division Zixibacteria bacterium]|nr:flavin reductase family protein [candidate division Zixibacteria bacterium]